MKIGLIGNGHWGRVYQKTFDDLGLELDWVTSRNLCFDADAIIIATPAETHYDIAKTAISHGCHVLIEKPMVMDVDDAKRLIDLADRMEVVGFVGHVHLYSPAWRDIKSRAYGIKEIRSVSGGMCKTDPLWDWGSHDVAMRIDIAGEDCPHQMEITSTRIKRRFEIVTDCGSYVYDDPPTTPKPMEVLVTEFIAACEANKPNIEGLKLGQKVTEALCKSAYSM